MLKRRTQWKRDGNDVKYDRGNVKVEGLVRSYDLDVIGVEWDQSTDTWRHIDLEGNTITPAASYFDNHQVWGNIRPVNMAADGEINYIHGDASFAWDGTQGRVMVEYPKVFVKTEKAEGPKYRWWISPVDRVGFEIHPAFFQGDRIKAHIYLGAKEADLNYNGDAEAYDATHEELHSRTGYQPITGGQIWRVDFDAGENEPAIGDDISTPNDANWFIVDYLVSAGAWVTNDASGKIWVRKPGDATNSWLNNDVITNNTQSNTLGNCEFTGGALTAIGLTIGNVRTYAGNIGDNWHLMNVWSQSLIQLLYYVEFANPDCQTEIGKGIVDKASGTGFAGELTGIDGIDGNVASDGTGSGTGTNGLTPVCYRWLENLWGNVWKFVDGYNAINASYQVLNRKGDNTPKDNMDDAQTPLSSDSAPTTTDGYITDILWDNGFELLFFANALGGSSSSYLYDYWYAHNAGETNILLSGGFWAHALLAGVGSRDSYHVASSSYRMLGARVEFRK
jgi:hypothetical protein